LKGHENGRRIIGVKIVDQSEAKTTAMSVQNRQNEGRYRAANEHHGDEKAYL